MSEFIQHFELNFTESGDFSPIEELSQGPQIPTQQHTLSNLENNIYSYSRSDSYQDTSLIFSLVTEVQKGNLESFGSLYEVFQRDIFLFAYKSVLNRQVAEDLVQDVFVKAFKSIGKFEFRQNTSFHAWIFTIARNLLRDNAKKHDRRQEIQVSDFYENSEVYPAIVYRMEGNPIYFETLQLNDAFTDLTPEQQKVVALRVNEELSVKETAEKLGKTENNVKVTYHKALKRLQDRMLNQQAS